MPKRPKVPKSIVSPYQEVQKIGETMTLSVSARGTGLCIYLPKQFVDLYGLWASDILKVQFKEHYRLDPKLQQEQWTKDEERPPEEEEDSPESFSVEEPEEMDPEEGWSEEPTSEE
jgi:hypothetical protein